MRLPNSNNKKNIDKIFKKKILIISKLKKNLIKTSVIYLNEGCLQGGLIKNDFNKKLLPNYPHLTNIEVYKNYFYLLTIYEYFLKIISLKLNKIHNVNYSKKYWRIVIGYWLFEFISIVFDNWKRLKCADRPPGAWIYRTAHSVRANKDWYGRAQPPWPLPREGVG